MPQGDPSSGQGSRGCGSRKVGDLDKNALPEGLVAVCNHAECRMSVHLAPLVAGCRSGGIEPSGGAHRR
jgi:hypothetical protein